MIFTYHSKQTGSLLCAPPPSPLQVTLLKCLPSLLPSSLNSEILATGFDIQRLSMDLAKWLL